MHLSINFAKIFLPRINNYFMFLTLNKKIAFVTAAVYIAYIKLVPLKL